MTYGGFSSHYEGIKIGFAGACFGTRCEFNVPKEAFMVLPLTAAITPNCGGGVKCPPEFSDV